MKAQSVPSKVVCSLSRPDRGARFPTLATSFLGLFARAKSRAEIRRRRRHSRRKERLRSFRVHCSLRSQRLALSGRCLPHSLADEERVCSLDRPGQRRTSLAPRGGARFCRRERTLVSVGFQACRPSFAMRRVWFSTSRENMRLIAARSMPGRSTVPVKRWVRASLSAATR